MKKFNGPKVLIFDVETAPILGYVWGLWENNVGLNQIKSEWHLLSWSAKWLGDKEYKTMYMDQRNAKNIEDDKRILSGIWKLLDEADVVITQNGKNFDVKKLNARFILNGFKPPSSYKHIDTLQIAKKYFAFTSNKLAWMSDKLCKKYKKLTHPEFTGFDLWKACLEGNKKAWKQMEEYNKQDVWALEELYKALSPWNDNSINFNLYNEDEHNTCKCSGTSFHLNGYSYTASGKYHRYKCVKCGSETRGRKNLLSKEKRQSLHASASR